MYTSRGIVDHKAFQKIVYFDFHCSILVSSSNFFLFCNVNILTMQKNILPYALLILDKSFVHIHLEHSSKGVQKHTTYSNPCPRNLSSKIN